MMTGLMISVCCCVGERENAVSRADLLNSEPGTGGKWDANLPPSPYGRGGSDTQESQRVVSLWAVEM